MYRRIEIIHESEQLRDGSVFPAWKTGLMGACVGSIVDTWIDKLTGPRAGRNCRFFFTELGWREVGRCVVEACGKVGQKYRVIKIKERSVDVIARGPFEVAVRPRKRRK